MNMDMYRQKKQFVCLVTGQRARVTYKEDWTWHHYWFNCTLPILFKCSICGCTSLQAWLYHVISWTMWSRILCSKLSIDLHNWIKFLLRDCNSHVFKFQSDTYGNHSCPTNLTIIERGYFGNAENIRSCTYQKTTKYSTRINNHYLWLVMRNLPTQERTWKLSLLVWRKYTTLTISMFYFPRCSLYCTSYTFYTQH